MAHLFRNQFFFGKNFLGYCFLLVFCFFDIASLGAAELTLDNKRPRVGVYYFPGWKDHAEASRPFPWRALIDYPERKPLLGWYQEGDDNITLQHLCWMRDYSIDYVIYDWYWTPNGMPRLDHAIESFLRISSDQHRRRFSIMWANHNMVPISETQFLVMVDHMVEKFFADYRYETVNGRPLLIIFSPENLERRARVLGLEASDLLKIVRSRSQQIIGKDPFIMGATHAVEKRVNNVYLKHGYDAYTAYNYHYGVEGVFRGANYSHSYVELLDGYWRTWNWMINNSKLPYAIPVTSGWDRRPWGGSNDLLHDNSGGAPHEFEYHISQAVRIVRSNSERTLNRIHVCCWNEFGEGSYIEPTHGFGFGFLESLKRALN